MLFTLNIIIWSWDFVWSSSQTYIFNILGGSFSHYCNGVGEDSIHANWISFCWMWANWLILWQNKLTKTKRYHAHHDLFAPFVSLMNLKYIYRITHFHFFDNQIISRKRLWDSRRKLMDSNNNVFYWFA